MLAPIIRLQPLSYEEMYVLIERLADIHSQLYGYERRLEQDDMIGFIKTEFGRIGASQNLTPREITGILWSCSTYCTKIRTKP